jgi:hypothetical protein
MQHRCKISIRVFGNSQINLFRDSTTAEPLSSQSSDETTEQVINSMLI